MYKNEVVNNVLSNLSLVNISSGFFIGLAVGFFLKKSFKIVLFLFGLLIVTLFYLQNQDIINLSNDTLLTGTDRFVALIKSVALFIKEKLSFLQLSGGAGALAGFLVGLKMG